MDMNCHEILEQKMCKELEMIQAKYAQNPAIEMSVQDLEKVDKLYHALKSMATYTAMNEAEEYSEDGWSSTDGNGMGGNSGRRGRSPMTGRYVSRDSRYSDGYNDGYSSAMEHMNGGNSGHYPMPYYPHRW